MRVLLPMALFSLVACGGSSVSTGLPRDKAINTLSAAEQQTACINVITTQVYTDAEITGLCAADLLAQGQMACTKGLDACVAQSKAGIAQIDASKTCTEDAKGTVTTCGATVGDLEDCLSSVSVYVNDRYGSVTCSTTNPPTTTFDAYHQPGCATLNAKCPTFFGG